MKNKKLWISLIVIILLVVSGYFAYQYFFPKASETAVQPIQTATIRRGNIQVLASGIGEIVPANEIELAFSVSGYLEEMSFRVGEKVSEGDILARLGDISQLELNINIAELDLLEAQNALDAVHTNADLVAAQAALDLVDAKESLDDAKIDLYYDQEGNRASNETYSEAYANLLSSQDDVERAQEQLDKYASYDDDYTKKAQAIASLESARSDVTYYSYLLHWYDGTPTTLEQERHDAEIAYAEAQVAEAERYLEIVSNGPDPYQVALAESNLANKEQSLLVALDNLDGSSIYAPIDGTILSISANQGEQVNTNTIITIANLDQPLLEIYLDETDFDKLGLDYPVEIFFDAIPDSIFSGTIIQVDPVLTSSNNISTIKGLVQLDDSYSASAIKLPIGSNAAVDVIAENAEQVVLVPIEALREITPGNYAVFVIENNEPVLRIIEVGIIDITYAEVISGLEIGEIVSTGIIEVE
jgi:HlyD family secretion protein